MRDTLWLGLSFIVAGVGAVFYWIGTALISVSDHCDTLANRCHEPI